jgi:hypothetical protein
MTGTKDNDHPGAKLRSQHSQAALGKQLQQIARQHEYQSHAKQRDQYRESVENHNLLIVPGAYEREIESGLRYQNRQQKENRAGEQDHVLLAVKRLDRSSWNRLCHRIQASEPELSRSPLRMIRKPL